MYWKNEVVKGEKVCRFPQYYSTGIPENIHKWIVCGTDSYSLSPLDIEKCFKYVDL